MTFIFFCFKYFHVVPALADISWWWILVPMWADGMIGNSGSRR